MNISLTQSHRQWSMEHYYLSQTAAGKAGEPQNAPVVCSSTAVSPYVTSEPVDVWQLILDREHNGVRTPIVQAMGKALRKLCASFAQS
jgi:hypothetical protein